MEKLQEMVKSKNGKIIDVWYNIFSRSKDDKFKVTLECSIDNHVWTANVNKILHRKSWCPKCGHQLSATLEDAKKIATERGGECLSTELITNKTPLLWKCGNKNHPSWEATFGSIKYAESWCPSCGKYNILEEYTRACFMILCPDYSFINTRSMKCEFLTNPKTGRQVEIDGLCLELKLGYEYNGKQHYEAVERFGGEAATESTKERDKLKADLCVEAKINLIVVPFTVHKNDIFSFVYSKLKEIAVFNEKINSILPSEEILKNISVNQIDQKAREYKTNEDTEKYQNMVKIVASHGGTLHTSSYISAFARFEITCGNKNNPHRYETCYNNIVNQNKWCWECHVITKSISITDILSITKNRIVIERICRQDRHDKTKKAIMYEKNEIISKQGTEPRGKLEITFHCLKDHPSRTVNWSKLKDSVMKEWNGCLRCRNILRKLGNKK